MVRCCASFPDDGCLNGIVLFRVFQTFELQQSGKQFQDFTGQFRMLRRIPFRRNRFTAPRSNKEMLGEFVEQRGVLRVWCL